MTRHAIETIEDAESDIVERLRDVAKWTEIIQQHRRKTDDQGITYVLKDGTRVHEDESIVAKLAASLSGALETSSAVATEAADTIVSLRAAIVKLTGVA